MITEIWGYPCTHLFEVGAVVREGVQPRTFTPGQTLQIVAGGYHVERKAMPIALHARDEANASRRQCRMPGWTFLVTARPGS